MSIFKRLVFTFLAVISYIYSSLVSAQSSSSTNMNLQLTIDGLLHPSRRLVQFSFFNFESRTIECDWLWLKAEYQETDIYGDQYSIGYRTVVLSNVHIPPNTFFFEVEAGIEQITYLEQIYNNPKIIRVDRTVNSNCYYAAVPTLDEIEMKVGDDDDSTSWVNIALSTGQSPSNPRPYWYNTEGYAIRTILNLNPGESLQSEYRNSTSGSWKTGETFHYDSPSSMIGEDRQYTVCVSSVRQNTSSKCVTLGFPFMYGGTIYYRFRRQTPEGVSDWTYTPAISLYYDS